MVVLIAGCSHTGKTLLAQKLLQQYHMPYLSIDHLKMGLIRSGQTSLTPEDDDALTAYLWPIVREMVKTAVENRQNLIVEGCYIPFDWAHDFPEPYLADIRYCCLIMSEAYIDAHYADIKAYSCAIEQRAPGGTPDKAALIAENRHNLALCKRYGCDYILIDSVYDVTLTL
ncbi:MAG TPA: adenylate kinase [Candidatus Aphodoplasma excrementigallinarum]|uniref:Adenylate kinase n=1 Tax=Candidatus Aphodoplasma excrementigallinarum TaxID=2840673 RepID=A0A9D1SZM4_9FIRM|nr:adenylate kinase [Candidatus Aphodoplasma excrementigallinarum]